MRPTQLLRAGWTTQQVQGALAAATPMTSTPSPARSSSGAQYHVDHGRICWERPVKDESELIPLANFSAQITEQIILDNGSETARQFVITGALDHGRPLPPVKVDAADFSTLSWVTTQWGAEASVAAGMGLRDRLREALQQLSQPTEKRIYTHSGWRKGDGGWMYLYHGGAVGADDVEVLLDPPLDRLQLPDAVVDVREAVEWSLTFLTIGPARIMVPLLAAAYLAPLAVILRPDFAVYLQGPTGSFKSELAALAQRHFGNGFDRKNLPVNWMSTDNSIEARLFILKDALATIDDYAPASDRRTQQDLERRAQRIIRSLGNSAGRGRLGADLRQRPDRPPRGLVLSTGEEVPPGHSIRGRMVVIEVTRDVLDVQKITALQQNGRRLSHALRGYLEWLRPQMDHMHTALPAVWEAARASLNQAGAGAHIRQAEALAHLGVALDAFIGFARSVGVDTVRLEELRSTGWAALLELGGSQSAFVQEADPADVFVDVLRTLLAQGAVALVPGRATGLEPPAGQIATPGRGNIGWVFDGHAYLMPGLARAAVVGYLERVGETFPHRPRSLHQALHRRGYIIKTEKDHYEAKVRAGGGNHRVLKIPLQFLQDRLTVVPGGAPGPDPESSPALVQPGAALGVPAPAGVPSVRPSMSPVPPVSLRNTVDSE